MIELIATATRSNPAIQGIQIGDCIHTLSLYADDILVYLSRPDESIPALMDTLTEYDNISGYKIDINKSVVMPLNAKSKADPPDTMFQWSPNHITYLGLKIPNEEHNSFSLNYAPLLKKTEKDCKRWNGLPFSLIGHINCIKMNVLPKYLYLFQMLPIPVPKQFFKQLDLCITQFIWRNKPPRIKMTILQNPLEKGGLSIFIGQHKLEQYGFGKQGKSTILSGNKLNRTN